MAWSTAGQANPVSFAAGVAAAVGAALVFGVTSVAEQRSTKRPSPHAGHVSLPGRFPSSPAAGYYKPFIC